MLSGTTVTFDTIDVRNGWNIIGSVSYPVLTADVMPIGAVTILSGFFGYGATGYFPEDTLKPGNGYWVKVSQAGQLLIQSGSVLASPPVLASHGPKARKAVLRELVERDEMSTIVIKDAIGRTQKLYFSANQEDLDLSSCEFPPPPPSGVMDVRYRSQRGAEVYDEERGGKQLFPIQIAEAEYPLKVSWSLAESDGRFALQTMNANGEQHTHTMLQGGTLTIEEPTVTFKLEIEGKVAPQLPTGFALGQNYPNPFNPITTIKYDLPVDSRVTLKIYSILGEEVRTVVNDIQSAGYKSMEWDSRNNAGWNVSTGVYFYRIEATSLNDKGKSFTQVKKMLLLK